MKVIDKEKLISEIENRMSIEQGYSTEDAEAGYKDCCKEIISFINNQMKEVDLENSMVCNVDWYDGFLLDYTQEQQDELLEKLKADYEEYQMEQYGMLLVK